MVPNGFITIAEARLLQIWSGTSKYHHFLLSFFLTDLGQHLKLLDHLIPLRAKNQISVSNHLVKICQLLLLSLDGQSLVHDFIKT
jgi:hypothetical protein